MNRITILIFYILFISCAHSWKANDLNVPVKTYKQALERHIPNAHTLDSSDCIESVKGILEFLMPRSYLDSAKVERNESGGYVLLFPPNKKEHTFNYGYQPTITINDSCKPIEFDFPE